MLNNINFQSKYIFAFLILIIGHVFLGCDSNSSLSEEELDGLKDYNSSYYEKIDLKELGLSKEEVKNVFNISDSIYKNYDLSYYYLDYDNMKEIHAVGNDPKGNCFRVAVKKSIEQISLDNMNK